MPCSRITTAFDPPFANRGVPRVTVEPVLPADVVGLFVLIPGASTGSRTEIGTGFDAMTLEGSLISPAKLAEVADRKADEQTDADYHIPKGLTLRDETARYFRIGQALFRELFAGIHPHSRRRSIHARLLRDVFGFTDVAVASPRSSATAPHPQPRSTKGTCPCRRCSAVGRSRPRQHPSFARSAPFCCHVAAGLAERRRERALGLCCNGEHLRLLRDNQSLTRPAYLEANLRQIFESEDFAGFAVLWLIFMPVDSAGRQPRHRLRL